MPALLWLQVSLGVRSSASELRSPAVGAPNFPVLTVKFRDAQFDAPPLQSLSSRTRAERDRSHKPERKFPSYDPYLSLTGAAFRAQTMRGCSEADLTGSDLWQVRSYCIARQQEKPG